jgi:DNA-binding transcriptional MerR regulator
LHDQTVVHARSWSAEIALDWMFWPTKNLGWFVEPMRSVNPRNGQHSQGLLPGVARDKGGRRVYSNRHVAWLDLMERLRHTGMSISQMREYTALVQQGGATLKRRRDLLAAHRKQVQSMISRWNQALALIDAKVEFYDEWVCSGERPSIEPHRRVCQSQKTLRIAARP